MKKRVCSRRSLLVHRQLVERLDKINITLEGMLSVLGKPENKVMVVLKYAGAIMGVFGILTVIEQIRQWIIGG